MPARIILCRNLAYAAHFQTDFAEWPSTAGAVEEADHSSSRQREARATDALRHEARFV